MRVLVLILMSDGFPYDKFREVWKTYMKSHPNVDCYFYTGKPNLFSEYLLTDDTLYIRISNSLSNIFERTLRAFRYFMNMRPNTYSFMFRANASTLINLHRYYDMCKEFPKENFCSAITGTYPQRDVKEFPSGCGYTLSIDLVKRFARTPDLQNVYIDDVSIGYYLGQWGIPIVPSSRYRFAMRPHTPEEIEDAISKHFHFRFRNDVDDRQWDIDSMRAIANIIYSKK